LEGQVISVSLQKKRKKKKKPNNQVRKHSRMGEKTAHIMNIGIANGIIPRKMGGKKKHFRGQS